MPLVSVVMPVHNTRIEYLKESVDSILNQTYNDFEFIIIDDYSDSTTESFLKKIDDQRVRVFRNQTNIGVTKSLIIGFEMARGKYIARMDSDDIALDYRIEKQVEYMEENPDVIVCGSSIRIFCNSEELKTKGICRNGNIDDRELFRIRLLFCNCGPAHPTAFFNNQLLKKYAVTYNAYYENSQDYAMWVSCSSVARMHIISEVLLNYREHELQISTKGSEKQRFYAKEVRKSQLDCLFDTVSDEDINIHERVINGELPPKESIKWLRKLKNANQKKRVYDTNKFSNYINDLIFQQQMIFYTQKRKAKKCSAVSFVLFAPTKHKVKCLLRLFYR